MGKTQTKQSVLTFSVSGLPEAEVYKTIMGEPRGFSKVAGVRSAHLKRWDPHIYVVVERDADVGKTVQLIELRLEALHVHYAHLDLFNQIDGSVTVCGGSVKVSLGDKLRFILGDSGLKKLVGVIKTLDIDEFSLSLGSNGFTVRPGKKGIVFYCRLRDDIKYYLDLIAASRLMQPDARRLVRID